MKTSTVLTLITLGFLFSCTTGNHSNSNNTKMSIKTQNSNNFLAKEANEAIDYNSTHKKQRERLTQKNKNIQAKQLKTLNQKRASYSKTNSNQGAFNFFNSCDRCR